MGAQSKQPACGCVFCGRNYVGKQSLDSHLHSHTKEKWFECRNCSSQFSTLNSLRRHKIKCKSDTFQCEVCSEKFHTLWTLTTHRNTHYVQCPDCNQVFKSKGGLKGHYDAVHALVGRYKCPYCPLICRSESHYTVHLRKHTGEKPFACEKCPRRFTRRNLLRIHMESHTDSNLKQWICKDCGKQSYSQADFLKHLKTHTKPYSCDLCDKRFSAKHALKTHIFSHTGERPFKCKLCPKTYRGVDQLTHHEKSFHGLETAKHECEVCNKLFHRTCELKIHLKRHQNQRFYNCLFCEKLFVSRTAARDHLRRHINETPFFCNTCGTELKSSGELSQHKLQKHVDNTPYACDKCPRKFTWPNLLKKHMISHDDFAMSELMCEQCGKQFYSKIDLLNHENIHTKPYKCELCKDGFSSQLMLETHILSHTGERPFKCEPCSKAYRTKRSLAYHQNTFHGLQQAIHHCKVCAKGFYRRSALKEHLETHKIQKTHKCIFCERYFATIAAARNHLHLHTRESPFICRTCGKECKSSGQLTQHTCKDLLDLILNQATA